MESGDEVPDERTVWFFREVLTSKGLVEKLFTWFRDYLEGKGLIMNEGKMIDADYTVEYPFTPAGSSAILVLKTTISAI